MYELQSFKYPFANTVIPTLEKRSHENENILCSFFSPTRPLVSKAFSTYLSYLRHHEEIVRVIRKCEDSGKSTS